MTLIVYDSIFLYDCYDSQHKRFTASMDIMHSLLLAR